MSCGYHGDAQRATALVGYPIDAATGEACATLFINISHQAAVNLAAAACSTAALAAVFCV